jgi:hypothetical protein
MCLYTGHVVNIDCAGPVILTHSHRVRGVKSAVPQGLLEEKIHMVHMCGLAQLYELGHWYPACKLGPGRHLTIATVITIFVVAPGRNGWAPH